MSYRKRHIKHKIHKIRPRKSIFKRPVFWLIFLLTVIFTGSVYLIFFYSGFQINNIVISGNQKVNTEEIKNLASLHASSKSILFSNTNNLSKEILEKFPIVETADVNKNFPQTLVIFITERKQVAVLCNASPGEKGKCYLIDENGVIFENSAGNPENMPVIWHPMGGEIFFGQQVLDKNIAAAFIKAGETLKDIFQINITDIFLPDSNEMDVKTNEGWSIYFDPSSDIDLQITKVKLLLTGEISETARKNLKYIDMRFKDRAYYK